MFEDKERHLCIICSKGTLDMAYPGLVLANAALMEGIDVTMFFTFWGLDMINDEKMDIAKLDFPPVREYMQTIADAGGKMYACKLSMDMMGLEKEDLFDEVDSVVGAMEFMEMSEDAQIIFI